MGIKRGVIYYMDSKDSTGLNKIPRGNKVIVKDTKEEYMITDTISDAGATISTELVAGKMISSKEVLDLSTEASAYGCRWHIDSDSYESIGNRSYLPIHSKMKRCITTWNGVDFFTPQTKIYLDEENSSLTAGDWSDITSELSNPNNQIMVEIPKFYYRMYRENGYQYYLVSETNKPNFSVHPAFVKSDGSELDYIYVGAFEAILLDGSNNIVDTSGVIGTSPFTSVSGDETTHKLVSLVGQRPMTEITRSMGRQMLERGGRKGYHWHTYSAIRLLYITEYHNWNSQETIGGNSWTYGQTDKNLYPTDYQGVQLTGLTVELGNKTGIIKDEFGSIIANSYRGIENFFGHIWNFLDGVNINPANREVFVCPIDKSYVDEVTGTGDYTLSLGTQPTVGGWQKTHAPDNFIVESLDGDSTRYLTDHYWTDGDGSLIFVGGHLNLRSRDGLAYLGCDWNALERDWHVGCRP
jgi:hypothetical protein